MSRGHVGKRPRDLGERVAERLGLQHRAHDQAGERQRGGERPGAPARRRQPAVGEHPGDRGHADEEQRPGAVGDDDGPRAAGQRARVPEHGVARIALGEPDRREDAAVREQQPADRVAPPPRGDEQAQADRGERRHAPGDGGAEPGAVAGHGVEHGGAHEQDRDAGSGDPRQTHPAIISARARVHNRVTTGPIRSGLPGAWSWKPIR